MYCLGEKYNLLDSEIADWQDRILDCLEAYGRTHIKEYLYLFIVWIYEYIEALQVNDKNLAASFSRLKEAYPNYSNILFALFKARGAIVHKCYLDLDNLIEKVLHNAESLDFVLIAVGFRDRAFTKARKYSESSVAFDVLSKLG